MSFGADIADFVTPPEIYTLLHSGHINVTLNTSICPECKRVYISGGVTKSAISAPKDKGNNVDAYA